MQCPHCFQAHKATEEFDACCDQIHEKHARCRVPGVHQVGDAYWILGFELPMGPYAYRKDAVADMQGVARFYKHEAKGL